MSWYYSFYVLKDTGEKNEKNERIFTYAGALTYSNVYNRQTGEVDSQSLKAVPLECRSRSFINGDTYNSWSPIDYSNLDDKAKEYLLGDMFDGEPELSDYEGAYMNIKKFDESFSADCGVMLHRGFITIEEFDVAVACGYDPEFFEYEVSVKSAEFIANLPAEERAKYVSVSYLDTNSDAYISNVIYQACDMLHIWPNNNGDYYILCWQG